MLYKKGLILISRAITASWLYMPAHKYIFEDHFNNLPKVDVETLDEDC